MMNQMRLAVFVIPVNGSLLCICQFLASGISANVDIITLIDWIWYKFRDCSVANAYHT